MSLRLQHFFWQVGVVTLCLACAAAPVVAASDHASGDGSDADNDRLLPGIYPADPVLANADWLGEPYHPFFDVDWSIALRGTYTKATAGERFDVRLAPSLTLTHQGTRSAATINGNAEITRQTDGQIDVSALRLGFDGGYALDSVTNLTAKANLSLTQPIAGTPGLAPTIASAPKAISGGAGLGVTRQFGKLSVGLTGDIQRTAYGSTTLTDGTITDNSERDLWGLDAGLRVGFQATPIFELFGVAGLGRDTFDKPSSVLLVKTDATETTLRGGVTGRWNGILEATGSVGVGTRRFDDATLGETTNQLYDASITFTPDPTWRFTAGFATSVAPPGPNAPGTTRIDNTANAEVAYTVNSWLALRALADWNSARFTGSADTESGYGWGAGADYKVNAHTALTADYDYDYADSTANGVQEAHRVMAGITLSR